MSVVINGSAGVTTNSGAVYNGIASGTAVASTSGTSIDFTSIPSWVKRITVMLQGVSTNGSSSLMLRTGTSGGVVSTGYLSSAGYVSTTSNTTRGAASTTGFVFGYTADPTWVSSGVVQLVNMSGNNWVCSGVVSIDTASVTGNMAGSIALSGALDRIRITTVNGTDTFDAGSINILYE